MEEGKVVFTGKSKSGLPLVIRYPKINDVHQIVDYLNILSNEQTYVNRQGSQMTYAEEEKYLQRKFKQIKDKEAIYLLAFIKEKLVGMTSLNSETEASSHVADISVSISFDHRNDGVGKLLMESVLEETEKQLQRIKIVSLVSFAINDAALALYKDTGFQEFGRMPGGLFRRGKYSDRIYMYKKIK